MNKVAAYASANDTNVLVERHANLVKRIAHHLMARLPASVIVDDLIQSGMIGLIEAARNFDGSKGASFETYAGIRIRGSMLDEIRRGDWVPRSVHKNSRAISDAIAEVEKEKNGDAKDAEVAAKLGVSLSEYHSMLSDVNCGRILGIDDLGVSEDVISSEESRELNRPFEGFANQRFQQSLAECIKGLPEREALVLSLYYDEELNLKEIGEVLSVSESRVSQIHSQALARVKTRMRDWTQ
ncbi:RNA polymerase sigma factor FliA [Agarivorans sp. OAG1]|uniref:RNA polymerase sigma factor FliA n=1 Tax=Agarivorans albus MKT 106 TaxID=1331007 RepID=R9PKR9_AGAAL|nr:MULTISPECIES: RNA polymerase sigma factor FliA [Agarivorans]MPW28778.1 FliA/WhiG family RNA polymerase sigma factor [Agarivorans sp. B2Z047]UQN41339.1 RNA polymerase sigma factor FliA [Agarivorans sp. B2Z047]BEU02715.1 RNA polymerase sigma factor FliA [Agarivorans sp. OAG1]GAD01930.1 RNA polymerase sigma factor for flagellar operon [Agarivorans albus MKT 106]